MRKTIAKIVLMLMLTAACALGFAACSADTPPVHTHTLTHHAESAATCTENGNIEFWECESCGKLFSDAEGAVEITAESTIVPAAHSFGEKEIVEATCTEEGSVTCVCSVCGETLSEVIPAKGHTVVTDAAVLATCTEEGLTEGSHCSVCGEVFERQEIIPALGHEYKDNVCIRCGEARKETQGLAYTLSDDGASYILSGLGTASEKEIVVPAEHEGLPVTSIADNAFQKTALTSVVLPDCMEKIGGRAFYFCDKLQSITLPKHLNSLGSYAFYACTSLNSLHIPADLTAFPGNAFYYLYELGTITADEENPVYSAKGNCLIETAAKTLVFGCKASVIPEDGSVETLGAECFKNVCYLTEIIVPDCVTSVQRYAFQGCEDLQSITLGKGLTEIPFGVFTDCESLENLTVPENVTEIGFNCFKGCSALASVTLPAGLKKVGSSAFENCGSLKSVYFEGSVENWCVIAFSGQKASPINYGADLYVGGEKISGALVIPQGVTQIADYTFFTLGALTSVTLPAGLEKIANNAFTSCYRITAVYNLSALSVTAGANGNGYVAKFAAAVYDSVREQNISVTDGFVCFADSAKGQYLVAGYLGNEKEIALPQSVNGHHYTVKPYAFAYTDLVSVTFPAGCDTIGDYACFGSKFETVIVNGVKTIGKSAFYDCFSLRTLTLGEGLETIGDSAFASPAVMASDQPNRITSLIIPNSVKSIDMYAFWGCANLQSVTVGSGVTHLGQYSFRGCKALTSVTFKNKTGWYLDDRNTESLNLSDPAKNAVYITETYLEHHWNRG